MKKVFTNSEIVHVFAQQTQSEGRTSGNNIFFEDNKIYSYGYHYKLAEIKPNNIVLINNLGYSNSTSKHIHLIMNATRQYRQIFYRDIDLNYVYGEIIRASIKIVKAKKPEIYAFTIIQKFENLTEYLKEFKQVNILKDSKYLELKKIYKSISIDKEKFIQVGKERDKKQKEREEKEFKISLDKFFKYEINYFTKKTNEDFLRISEDRTMIETTQGVKIPIQEAKKLYELITLGVNIKGLKISNFTIISINGTLKIGCHQINIKNVHEIGKQLINNF